MLTSEARTSAGVCPLCGADAERVFQKFGYWIDDCQHCGHRFAEAAGKDARRHVAQVYDDLYFFGGGAGYPDYLAEGKLLRAHGRWYGTLLSQHAPAGSVLDVGSAAGFILAGLTDAGWHGAGIEPNATMARYAREHLGLDVRQASIEDARAEGPYDGVTMVQVLSHVVDPTDALAAARMVTRPGSLLLIETWIRDSLTARAFGQLWHEYSPPSVLHWFTSVRLAHFAGQCGFGLIARGRPPKRIAGSHVRSVVRHAMGGSAVGRALAAMANIVPENAVLNYPADDLAWMLFRRN